MGTNVHLEDVPVRRKAGNGLWIGYSRRHQLFAVPIDPSFVEFVTVGARIDLRGTLRETPSARQATMVFALDRTSSRLIADEPLYIDAWTMAARN